MAKGPDDAASRRCQSSRARRHAPVIPTASPHIGGFKRSAGVMIRFGVGPDIHILLLKGDYAVATANGLDGKRNRRRPGTKYGARSALRRGIS